MSNEEKDRDNENSSSAWKSAWSEQVCIETAEYSIKGTVYMPKIGKRTRLLTEILNSENKQFLAITNCEVEYKLMPQREVEHYDFIEVNMSSILIMRPLNAK